MSETKKLNPAARETLEKSFKQLQELNQAVQNYLSGVIAGMGLEGQWKINPQTMELEKQEEPKKDIKK